ncbi:hypothetical protein BSR29_02280 [Boudabousia liubingyangii]|uniref:Aminoglycoside phosphotransferase domain-containing protein n=1 Tax=Boudabousia liubingyangii TaxID=1921764 RepID=A0A1Q5PQF7_9ACTO|nr:phosphotransferase [Boudabousia liubingyangii]OKL49797.1 hypothetical protein BSR29_02280 [Boudabousia liubingyangii]
MSQEFSPLVLASLAVTALPERKIVGLTGPQYETEDFAVTGVELADHSTLVVTAPKNAAAGANLEAQYHLLSILNRARQAGDLGFEVPQPVGMTRDQEAGKSVLVHTKVPGHPLTEDELVEHSLARSIGHALASLHSLDAHYFERANLTQLNPKQAWIRHRSLIRSCQDVPAVPRSLLKHWRETLLSEELWGYQAVAVHGDVSPESFLVVGNTVMAMRDFAKAHLGDPAQDLAWFLAACDEEFFEQLWTAYTSARPEADEGLWDRAQLWSELRIAQWLLAAREDKDKESEEAALSVLRDLAEGYGGQIDFTPQPVDRNAPTTVIPFPKLSDLEAAEEEETETIDPGAETSPATETATAENITEVENWGKPESGDWEDPEEPA